MTTRAITYEDVGQFRAIMSPETGVPFAPVPVTNVHNPMSARGRIMGLVKNRFLVKWYAGGYHIFRDDQLTRFVLLVEEEPSKVPTCLHGRATDTYCDRCW